MGNGLIPCWGEIMGLLGPTIDDDEGAKLDESWNIWIMYCG